MADEYLSGNVREKLKKARRKAETEPDFTVNVRLDGSLGEHEIKLQKLHDQSRNSGSFSDFIGACHVVIRHLRRKLPIQNVRSFTVYTHFFKLLTVRYDMIADQIHIDAIRPERV